MPSVIFGTSGLGNLFVAVDEATKLAIVKECFDQAKGRVVFDTAGKYGAGLALGTLGKCLTALNIRPEDVIISNKLGWLRTELKTDEPLFEPGVWRNLAFDAVQKISYDGMLECFEQGNALLNGYIPQMVSVHDPDEYLAKARDKKQDARLYDDILNAYRALYHLKVQGKVRAVGVGAKDWKTIQRIKKDVPLDWIMIANSMTIKHHPQELFDFIDQMRREGTLVINSAVFHSGFLVGGDYFDYKFVQPGTAAADDLFRWRESFFSLCKRFAVKPAEACVQFALHIPGISTVALSTTSPKRVKENIALAEAKIPVEFWEAMETEGIIRPNTFGKTES